MSLFRRLWADDAGAVLSVELTLILGLVVFGSAAGLSAVRDAAARRLGAVAGAIDAIPIPAPPAPSPTPAPQPVQAAAAVNVTVVLHPPAPLLTPAP